MDDWDAIRRKVKILSEFFEHKPKPREATRISPPIIYHVRITTLRGIQREAWVSPELFEQIERTKRIPKQTVRVQYGERIRWMERMRIKSIEFLEEIRERKTP